MTTNTFTFEFNNLKSLLTNKGIRKDALEILKSENPSFEVFQFVREAAPKQVRLREKYPVAEGLRICLRCVKKELADGVREEQAVMASTYTIAQSFTSKVKEDGTGGKVYDKCTSCRSEEAAEFHKKPEQVKAREQRKAKAEREKAEAQLQALLQKLGKTVVSVPQPEVAMSATA